MCVRRTGNELYPPDVNPLREPTSPPWRRNPNGISLNRPTAMDRSYTHRTPHWGDGRTKLRARTLNSSSVAEFNQDVECVICLSF
jgi:hypothetical protein